MSRGSIIFVIAAALSAWSVPARSQDAYSKTGGVCFRVDDNQYGKWSEYAAVFAPYGAHFTFAVNPGLLDPSALPLIKTLAAAGNEFADHTPDHTTFFFSTPVPSLYAGRKGVHHISGNRIYLEIARVDTACAWPGEVRATIQNGQAVITGTDWFKGYTPAMYIGLYAPDLKLLFLISGVAYADGDQPAVVDLLSPWGESISTGTFQRVRCRLVTYYDIRMSDDAMTLLAERSLDLITQYQLPRPQTWIQPGGPFAQLYSEQVKRIWGDRFQYSAGAVYPDLAAKGYNEWNPLGTRQFAMEWGDFLEDYKDGRSCKEIIADRYARHYVSVGHSHFGALYGGWQAYLKRTDSLLAWCTAKGIPIRTYAEWARLLYESPTDPSVNIIPPLNVDLDEDGNPDGYTIEHGAGAPVLDTAEGSLRDGGRSWKQTVPGTLCRIRNLAGLEHGANEVSLWTKGGAGDTVEVAVALPSGGTKTAVFRFPAATAEWRYRSILQLGGADTVLRVPDDASTCDILVRAVAVGTAPVKISGLTVRKRMPLPLRFISTPPQVARRGGRFAYLPRVANTGTTAPVFTLTGAPAWLSLAPGGVVQGTVPAGVVSASAGIVAWSGVAPVDTQTFTVRVLDPDAPAVVSAPVVHAAAGGLYEYTMKTERDSIPGPNDTLAFRLASGPSWLSVNSYGCLSGRVGSDTGSVSVAVMVTNARGIVSNHAFTLHTSHDVELLEYDDAPSRHGWIAVGLTEDEWYVSRNSADRTRCIELSGQSDSGGSIQRRGDWLTSTFSLRFCSSSSAVLAIAGIDSLGREYALTYRSDEGAPEPTVLGGILHLGRRVLTGEWLTMTRDLGADLAAFGRAGGVLSVTSITISGTLKFQNLKVGVPAPKLQVTGVQSASSENLPQAFALAPNFPNPFNPATTIAFDVPRASHVSIEIFDLLGRCIQTLASGYYMPGSYRVCLDASHLASGMYVYRLTARDGGREVFTASRKLVLMR